MATCKICGHKFHWCSSCQMDYHWEDEFCSSYCYDKYLSDDPKLKPIKEILFKLSEEDLDTLDNLDSNILADLIVFCSNNHPDKNNG